MKTKKIALFGGSFNPIHNQHIRIIKEVLSKTTMDQVWIIPSKNHPFNKQQAPAKDRIKMIRLGVKTNPKVKINKIELKSEQTNYTLRIIKKLKAKYKHKFYWIIGSDILYEIKKWHRYNELLNEVEFIVIKRKDYPIKKIAGMKMIEIQTNSNSIASSGIRKNISQNKSLKDMVPSSIQNYIEKKGLYKK